MSLLKMTTTIALILATTTAMAAEEKRGFFSRAIDKVVHAFKPRVHFASPPPEQFFYNPLPSYSKLKDNTVVTILTPEVFFKALALEDSVIRADTIGQDLYLLTEVDRELLNFTMRLGGRESTYTATYDLNGRPLSFSSMYGGQASAVPLPTIFEGLSEAFNQAPHAQLIDIVHTHPGYEFISRREKEFEVRGSPLSGPDIAHTIDISHQFPDRYVRIRAVLPNGYSYSTTFYNGQPVHDPIYSKTVIGQETKIFFFKQKYPDVKISDEMKQRIVRARDLSELVQIEKTKLTPQSVEKILKTTGIPEKDANYNQLRTLVSGLLGQGHSEREVVKMTLDTYVATKLDWLLDGLGISIDHKDYALNKFAAEGMLRQGLDPNEILTMMKTVNNEITDAAKETLPAAGAMSCHKLFKK